MTDARLTSAMLVGAIRRLAEREGGFAAILQKGDDTSGAIILELHQRGVFVGLYERMPTLSGASEWVLLSALTESRDAYLEKRRKNDPDLSVVELDVPDATQFIPLIPSGT